MRSAYVQVVAELLSLGTERSGLQADCIAR